MNKNKIIAGLAGVTLLLFASTIIIGRSKNVDEPSKPAQAPELPKGEAPRGQLAGCTHAHQSVRRKLLEIEGIIAYEMFNDPDKKGAYDEALKARLGDRYRPELTHGSDGSNHPKSIRPVRFPNVSVAIVKEDPFNGCEVVVQDLDADLTPSTLTDKQLSFVYRALWLARFEAVERDFNITAQSWLDNVTHAVGIGHRQLTELDIEALKALKMKLPEWYAIDMKPGERRRLLLDLSVKKARNGKLPLTEPF